LSFLIVQFTCTTIQHIKDMPRSRTDTNTLATLETQRPSLPSEPCTHYTPTPIGVKRMACVFTGGIPELDDTKHQELEMQTCARCQPSARAKEWEERIARRNARSAQTSGSNTPTSPASELLGPFIRYKVDKVTLDRLLTAEGTMDEEPQVSCLSIFNKRW
jgi:hypothetical protein